MTTIQDDAQRLVKALSREYLILRTIALVFLGAGINILFIGLTMWVFAHSLSEVPIFVLPPQSEQADTFSITGTHVLFYALYILLGIVYSVTVSIPFKPKRIVSPLTSQLVTSSFMAVIFASPFILAPQYVNANDARNAFSAAFSVFFIFAILGFIQHAVARRIVGLNGSLEDIDKRVYPMNKSYDQLKKILLGEGFLSLGEFTRARSKSKSKLILESKARTTEKIILVLTPDNSDSQKSFLAAFAYEELYNTIMKSVSASAWLDSIIAYLQIEASKPPMHQDLTRTEAYVTALKHSLEATKPKISGIAYLPRYQITTLIATTIIAIIVVVGWQLDWLTDEAFVTTIILIAIELLFVFVPYALESAKKSSDDED